MLSHFMVEFDGVEFSYRARRPVLRRLSFGFVPGRTYALLGHNGAGKTTLLRLAARLLKPDVGRVIVHGDGNSRGAVSVGVMPENVGIYPRLSAWENVCLRHRLVSSAPPHRHAEEALRGIGLFDRRHERAETWSNGMKRRLALACATVGRPDLLLLDEPFAALDPASQQEMARAIRAFSTPQSLTIFSSHELALVRETCDAYVMLREGRIASCSMDTGEIAEIETTYFKENPA